MSQIDDELEAIRARKRAELQEQETAAAPVVRPRGVQNAGDTTLVPILRDGGLVFVDLWAPWCGPCRMFAPAFAAAADKYDDKAVFVKVNVDENPVVSQQLQVQSIPTLMVFKDGQLLTRQAGAMPGPAFDRFVQRFLD